MAKPKKKTKKARAKKPAKKPVKKAAKAAKKPTKKKAAAKQKPAAKKKAAAKKPAAKKPAKAAAEPMGEAVDREMGDEVSEAIDTGAPDRGDAMHEGATSGGSGSNGVPAAHELAKLAMAGDLDAIFAIVDGDAESDRDGLAYKWLAAASDFGHEAADDMIGDLLEASSLRYDDDQLVTGAAHWELGIAYLTGGEGLPRDLEKGRTQLAAALERGFPASIQDSEKEIADARATFAPDALAVFDAVFSEGTSGALDDRGEEDEEEDGEEEGD